MKYVMFTYAKSGLRQPILFPDFLSHDDMRAGAGFVATSAGFFSLSRMGTSGKSDSLGLVPCNDDAKIIQVFLADILNSMGYIIQDTQANLERLSYFCTCGHHVSTHVGERSSNLCVILGCVCNEITRYPKPPK